MLRRGPILARWVAPVLLAAMTAAGCSDGGSGGPSDATAVTEPEGTIAPPETVETPALPVGTDTAGTEAAADEEDVAEIPVALAVALRSYGDEWTSLSFVRGGDAEWPDLVAAGIDRAGASGSATVLVDGVTVTVIAEVADSDAATAALGEAGATAIDVGGTTVYDPPASRRTPIGAALSGFDVVGTAHGLLVMASGGNGVDADQVASLASRPLAAWESSAVLSATVLEPLFGADRVTAVAGALDPADAYRVAHPGASSSAVDAWVGDAAAVRPPASPVMSAAGLFGLDPATASGRAVALYGSPEDATAAARWIEDLWTSAASYDGTTTWADAFGRATVTTDGTVLTLAVATPGAGWLAAPLPLSWAAAGSDSADAPNDATADTTADTTGDTTADTTGDTTGGTVSPAD